MKIAVRDGKGMVTRSEEMNKILSVKDPMVGVEMRIESYSAQQPPQFNGSVPCELSGSTSFDIQSQSHKPLKQNNCTASPERTCRCGIQLPSQTGISLHSPAQ